MWFTAGAIAAWRAEPRTTRGGQRRYSELAITTALTLRAVFRLTLRQAEGLIGSILALLGLDLAAPDHNDPHDGASGREPQRPTETLPLLGRGLLARLEAPASAGQEHNAAVLNGEGPTVETAPLPSGAQLLNAIKSVFSGMARSIIHNRDHKTLDDAKAAIERYFADRNAHFTQHPRGAGKKIWGKERELPGFSEANNCKDPRYR